MRQLGGGGDPVGSQFDEIWEEAQAARGEMTVDARYLRRIMEERRDLLLAAEELCAKLVVPVANQHDILKLLAAIHVARRGF